MLSSLISLLFSNSRIVLAGVAVLVALAGSVTRCQTWKESSETNLTHVGRLQTDSVRWHGDSLNLRFIIRQREGRIDTLNRQADDATRYATTYMGQRDKAVAQSDALTGRLTDEQKKTAYLRALVANQTLPDYGADNIPTIDNPAVVDAGLKTANRELIQRQVVDSLALSIGRRDAQIARLAGAGRTAIKRLSRLAAETDAKGRKGGLWPFNRKRRKQMQQTAADAQRTANDYESDLEKELNKQ